MLRVGLIGGSDCLISGHLQEVCAFLEGINPLNFLSRKENVPNETLVDLRDVIGQQQGNVRWKSSLQVAITC